MIIYEYDSYGVVPQFEDNESRKDVKEMREQIIAILYGWGLPIL